MNSTIRNLFEFVFYLSSLILFFGGEIELIADIGEKLIGFLIQTNVVFAQTIEQRTVYNQVMRRADAVVAAKLKIEGTVLQIVVGFYLCIEVIDIQAQIHFILQ